MGLQIFVSQMLDKPPCDVHVHSADLNVLLAALRLNDQVLRDELPRANGSLRRRALLRFYLRNFAVLHDDRGRDVGRRRRRYIWGGACGYDAASQV